MREASYYSLSMSNATRTDLTALDSDGEEFTLDFGFPTVAARTPADLAAHKALEARQDSAASYAFRGAMAAGLGLEAAKTRAAKARSEMT